MRFEPPPGLFTGNDADHRNDHDKDVMGWISSSGDRFGPVNVG